MRRRRRPLALFLLFVFALALVAASQWYLHRRSIASLSLAGNEDRVGPPRKRLGGANPSFPLPLFRHFDLPLGKLLPPPPRLGFDFGTVIVMWNPQNYTQRVIRFQETLNHLLTFDHTWTVAVELVYGENPFMVPPFPSARASLLRYRLPIDQVSWCKERLINLAIEALPDNFKYIAWIDSEVNFTNPNWVSEARSALSEYSFVQLFDRVNFLGPHLQVLDTERSIALQLRTKLIYQEMAKNSSLLSKSQRAHFWHPGYAWAATRAALNSTGGLLDRTFGGADKHMAFSLLWQANLSFFTPPLGKRKTEMVKNGSLVPVLPEKYFSHIINWQNRVKAAKIFGFGLVPGTISHMWHGDIRNRAYLTRWKIIHAFQLDPEVHFTRNEFGLDIWSEAARPMLRHMVAKHFKKRNEDRDVPLPPRWEKQENADSELLDV